MIYKNATLLGGDFRFRTADLEVQDGIITAIGNLGNGTDLHGAYLVPGLIDIHTHGCVGFDHLDGTPEAAAAMCRRYASVGTTSVLATIMTQSEDAMLRASENVCRCQKTAPGAHLRGIYYEGPFFSDTYRGAQHPKYLREVSPEFVRRLQEASGGLARIMSLAPEKANACELIAQTDLRIFCGHTDADYAAARAAYDAGAVGLTHTFNAMRPLHHREPGILTAAWETPSVFCECICDGFHVHPAVVRLLYRTVGRERFAVISDSIRPAGLPDGVYDSAGQAVTVKNGEARLADGTVAGSMTCLLDEVRNLTAWGICELADAVYAASAVPAKAAGIFDRVGSLEVGKSADLLILDENLHLLDVQLGKL